MSGANNKTYFVNVKDLSFKAEQIVVDLIRYLAEQLPQIEIVRSGNELEITVPQNMSKRVIRLRLRKFLYKKTLSEEYRPISFKENDKDGYIVKEKKIIQLSYY